MKREYDSDGAERAAKVLRQDESAAQEQQYAQLQAALQLQQQQQFIAQPADRGEVCQFFSRSGWCKWGDACRYVHMATPQAAVATALASITQSQLPAISPAASPTGEVCQFYARAGWCKYGDACKHSHDLPNAPAAPVPGNSGEPCLFFARAGWCKYGDTCKHSHAAKDVQLAQAVSAQVMSVIPAQSSGEICQFFARAGWCKYGDSCKHAHGSRSAQDNNAMSMQQMQIQQAQQQVQAQALAQAEAQQQAAASQMLAGQYVGPPRTPSGETCLFFARAGWCKYGDSCKHSHAASDVHLAQAVNMANPPAQSGEVCLFFSKAGWCKYGDACKHAHVGATGTCPTQPPGGGFGGGRMDFAGASSDQMLPPEYAALLAGGHNFM